jgi:hypothetical protein
MGLLGLWREIWRVERLNPNEYFVSFTGAHSAPFALQPKKKGKRLFCFCVYFRLLSTSAAAIIKIMMTTAAIAT